MSRQALDLHLLGGLLGAAVIALVVASTPIAAQGRGGQAPAKPSGPMPRLSNGKPDFSGVLMGGGGVSARQLKPGDKIELLPAAKKLQDDRLAQDDPEAHCLPTGVPRMNPYPWRIVQSV